MKVILTSVDPGPSQRTFVLNKLPALVGRNPGAQVCLDDRRVSRRHCRLDQVDGGLLIRDLGSKNGTFIEGMRIKQSLLRPGGKLTVGRISFVVDYLPEEQPPGPHHIPLPAEYDTYWEGVGADETTFISPAAKNSWWEEGPYQAPTEPDEEQ